MNNKKYIPEQGVTFNCGNCARALTNDSLSKEVAGNLFDCLRYKPGCLPSKGNTAATPLVIHDYLLISLVSPSWPSPSERTRPRHCLCPGPNG